MDYFDYNYDVIGLNFITTRVANKCTAMLKMLHIGIWFLFYKVTMKFSVLHGDSSRELHLEIRIFKKGAQFTCKKDTAKS